MDSVRNSGNRREPHSDSRQVRISKRFEQSHLNMLEAVNCKCQNIVVSLNIAPLYMEKYDTLESGTAKIRHFTAHA